MKTHPVKKVLLQHIEAVKAQNLDAIINDYTEDSVFITVTSSPDGSLEKSILKGKEAIKAAFESVFTNILPAGSSMEFTNQIVEGEIAFITWSAKSTRFTISSATDTFVIRNSKITIQTGFTTLIENIH